MSDVLALFGGGITAEVVLIILSLVAFEEAAGVASVGKGLRVRSTGCNQTDGMRRHRESLCGRTGRRGRRSRDLVRYSTLRLSTPILASFSTTSIPRRSLEFMM